MQDEWLRYSCQISLPGFGMESQVKLQQAKVLLVGAGGLGCPAAQYLAASGVGMMGIADFDTITHGNLHRQVLYTPAEAGLSKALVACKKLQEQNPQITLMPILEKITAANVMDIIKGYDIVVDGTDNFDTKYLLNDACVLTGKPLVYAAIYQYEGQLSVLNVLHADGTHSANYRDLFPSVNALQVPGCAEGGVIPTIAGIIGCMQANEVIKWITGADDLLAGKILMMDARSLQTRIFKTALISKTTITALPVAVPVQSISVQDLKNSKDKEKYLLIDVRNDAERQRYHIGGTHIPLTALETNLTLLAQNRSVVFYCESGRRSEEAVKIISSLFPDADVYSLQGGIKAWKEMETIK